MQSINQNWKFSPDYYQNSAKILDMALNQTSFFGTWRTYDPGQEFPADIRFASLPAFTKKDIRKNFPQGLLPAELDLNRGLASGEISLVQTSGTTDDKVTNIWNQTWWDASERSSWKLNSFLAKVATGEHREAILVNPRNVGIISDDADLPMEKRQLSRYLYLNEKTDTVSWTSQHMDRMIQEINSFKPAVLEANPSMLAKLCRYITSTKQKVHPPCIITFTYEYPTNFHLQQIRRVFDVPLASSYGTTETGYVFMQCEKGKLHQNTEFSRVDFQPFKPEHGGLLKGRILVTPLNNPWNFMLRFDVGDLATLDESGQCSCGRNSGLILKSVDGRKTNVTLTCKGRLVSLQELDNAICKLEGIDEYQFFQMEQAAYELRLVSRRADKPQLTDEAVKILKALYGNEATVNIIYKEAIAPEGSGKYQTSRSLFPIDIEDYLDTRYFPGNV